MRHRSRDETVATGRAATPASCAKTDVVPPTRRGRKKRKRGPPDERSPPTSLTAQEIIAGRRLSDLLEHAAPARRVLVPFESNVAYESGADLGGNGCSTGRAALKVSSRGLQVFIQWHRGGIQKMKNHEGQVLGLLAFGHTAPPNFVHSSVRQPDRMRFARVYFVMTNSKNNSGFRTPGITTLHPYKALSLRSLTGVRTASLEVLAA